MLTAERSAKAEDQIGGSLDELAVFAQAFFCAEVEVDAHVDAALAIVAVERAAVAVFAHQRGELAQISAQTRGRNGALWFFAGANAVWAARMENCLFGSLTVLAVACWAGQVFGRRAAWIAGLITALYPEAVAISVPVLSEAPFCLLVAVNLALWNAACRRVGGARRSPLDGALREPVENKEQRSQGCDSVRNPPFLRRFASRTLQICAACRRVGGARIARSMVCYANRSRTRGSVHEDSTPCATNYFCGG